LLIIPRYASGYFAPIPAFDLPFTECPTLALAGERRSIGRSAGRLVMASKRQKHGDRKLVEVRIIRGKGGTSIRTIVERAHSKPTGLFMSSKCGVQQPWDAIDERHWMWISEVDWKVRRFTAQPFRMEFHFDDGSVIVYFPDIERTMDTGIEIVEIKKTQAEISRDPDYARKIALARKACQARGWKFRVVTADRHILPGYLLENARLVRLDRYTRVASEDHLRLDEAMAKSHGRLSYGEAVAALSRRNDPWDRDGTARLHALIVKRVVCVDLTRRLTQDSAVVLYRHPLWRPSKVA
jgi:TnsA endonuclease N terminal